MLSQNIKTMVQNQMHFMSDVKCFVVIIILKYQKKSACCVVEQWALRVCDSDNNGHFMEVRIRAGLLLFTSRKYIYYVESDSGYSLWRQLIGYFSTVH